MDRTILCLFQYGVIKPDVVTYAIERARRTRSQLSILMLVEREASSSLQQRLSQAASRIESEGIPVAVTVEVGVNESMLVKHLATLDRVSAIIWGGDRADLEGWRRRSANHWLSKIAPGIDCPIISPTPRES